MTMLPTFRLPRLLRAATDLTRRGELAEATREIQRVLAHSGIPAPPVDPAATHPRMPEILGEFREVQSTAHGAATHVASGAAPDSAPGNPRGAPSAGPVTMRPARFSAGSCVAPAGTLAYKLYVPTGFDGMKLPLLVMLHGCKQDPDDFAAGTRMNALAQERGAIVVYPAQSARANGSKCWNWFQPGDQRRGAGEPALLAALTLQIIGSEAVDPQRVCIAGLSAGGAMAAIMAREYPDLYAAAGVHSGLPCGAAHDVASAFALMKRGPPATGPSPVRTADGTEGARIIVFHGDQDRVVHPRNGERIVEGSTQAPGSASVGSDGGRRYTRHLHRAGDGSVRAEHWLIHGGAHAWSGGSPEGSYADAAGPDASREMLRFFLEPASGPVDAPVEAPRSPQWPGPA